MYLKTYVSNIEDAYTNIATEKYLFDNCPTDTIIMMLWSNDNSVILGKNQNAFAEVNFEALKARGGKAVRRFTGGGAVYHDKQNVNFTFIAPKNLYSEDVQNTIILNAIRAFGINAEKNGRNDLVADGRKFSGAAFLHTNTTSMQHGTLLINVNTQAMSECLNVSKVKLEAKGVKSVRSRVVNLKELSDSINKESLIDELVVSAEKTYGVHAEKLEFNELNQNEINKIKELLMSEKWLAGKAINGKLHKEMRFDWGLVSVYYSVENNKLRDIAIFTDSLDTEGFDELSNMLDGKTINEISDIEKDRKEYIDIINLIKSDN